MEDALIRMCFILLLIILIRRRRRRMQLHNKERKSVGCILYFFGQKKKEKNRSIHDLQIRKDIERKKCETRSLKTTFLDCLFLKSKGDKRRLDDEFVKVGVKVKKICIFETTVTTRLLVKTVANCVSLESL